MWSEHCSYKSSRIHLKTLPTEGPRVAPGAGRERRRRGHRRRPRGRLQDRVAQPSRPSSSRTRARRPASAASSATSSRWAPGRSPCSTRCGSGRSTTRATRRILRGVVAGIGGYGNSIGIPTVGGEVTFDESYARQSAGERLLPRHRQARRDRQGRRPAASAIRCTTSAPRRAATAFTARRWRRPSSTTSRRRSVPRCRSAIRSWRSCCSRRVSK